MTRRLSQLTATNAAAPNGASLPYRSEAWFIASAGGRDAYRRGEPITAAPFTSHDVSWHAWRAAWVCAQRGEDITARYAHRPERRASHRVDHRAEAIADFRRYATDESIAPDLRDAAREILDILWRNDDRDKARSHGGRR